MFLGERGSSQSRWPFTEIGAVRESELLCIFRVLLQHSLLLPVLSTLMTIFRDHTFVRFLKISRTTLLLFSEANLACSLRDCDPRCALHLSSSCH